MTKTERELLDACVKHYMKNCEWARIEREGERYQRHLSSISAEIETIGIDIDILSGQLAEEREA